MKQSQHNLFAKGMIDLANIVAGALIFGQFVSGRPLNLNTFILGIILAIIFYFGAYQFSKSKNHYE